MSKFPIMDEMARNVAQKALDEVYYKDKSIREWVKIILSEDAISRQAVLDMMQMRMSGKELYKAVYDLPPIQPKAKMGHWIKVVEVYLPYICSECDKPEFRKSNYCPNCGAEMMGVEEYENKRSN